MLRNIPNRQQQRRAPTDVLRVPAADMNPTVNTFATFVLGSLGWTQQVIAQAGLFTLQVPGLPSSGRLLQAAFRVDPAVHVALPATLPTFRVFRYTPGSLDQLGPTVVDPSATVAAYDAAHSVIVPDLNFDLSETGYDWIQVSLTGETGANSVVGLNFLWVEFTIGQLP